MLKLLPPYPPIPSAQIISVVTFLYVYCNAHSCGAGRFIYTFNLKYLVSFLLKEEKILHREENQYPNRVAHKKV